MRAPLVPASILSVDPGKKTGWAIWRAGVLTGCGLTDGDRPVLPAGVPLLVIERPHEGEGKASKSDIITLSRRMGCAIMAARTDRVLEVLPVQWKGSVPKRVKLPSGKIVEPALDAIRAKMTDNDWIVFWRDMKGVAKSAQNNVLDAIGLGIWFLETRGVR